MNKKKKCIMFDEESRRDFVTGFHKRKIARRKHAAEKFEKQLKEAKKKIKLKARETYLSIMNPYLLFPNFVHTIEKQYELPEHTVKVCEFQTDINEEYSCESKFENETVVRSDYNNVEKISGISVNSIKEVKKIVYKQATDIMQNDKAFIKKNKLEKLKNRKKARKHKKLLEKQQKKKGNKRRR